jgi:hypothetical protein
VLLPLNYFMELGFFLLAGLLYWSTIFKKTERDWFLLTMFSVGLFLTTFLHSTAAYNDSWYRSIVASQLPLLLWATQIILKLHDGALASVIPKSQVHLLYALLVIGFCGVLYDLYLMRFANELGVREYLNLSNGRRNYAVRNLYERLNGLIRRSAVIQANPDSVLEAYSGSYGRNQTIAFDRHFGVLMGIDHDLFDPVEKEIAGIFSSKDLSQVKKTVAKYAIDVLIVKDLDPIWSKKDAWCNIVPAYSETLCAKAFIFNDATRL